MNVVVPFVSRLVRNRYNTTNYLDLFIITLNLKTLAIIVFSTPSIKNAERVLMVNMRVVVMLSVIILSVRAGNPY